MEPSSTTLFPSSIAAENRNLTPFNWDEMWNFSFGIHAQTERTNPCIGGKLLKLHNLTMLLASKEDLLEVVRICDGVYQDVAIAFTLLVVIMGIPGNIIALFTVLTLIPSTGTLYVALLSAVDLLSVGVKVAWTALNHYKVKQTDHSCQFLKMFSNFLTTYANWVLVLICFERFLTVWFPMKKRVIFHYYRACKVAFCVSLIVLAVYTPIIFTYQASSFKCILRPTVSPLWAYLLTYVPNVIYCILPAGFMVIFVALIATKLNKLQRTRRSMLVHETGNNHKEALGMDLNKKTKKQLEERARQERAITLMLVASAVSFIVLTFPFIIMFLMNPKMEVGNMTYVQFARFNLGFQVVHGLTYMTHAVNFYIYFLSCAKFRAQLKRLMCCKARLRFSISRRGETVAAFV